MKIGYFFHLEKKHMVNFNETIIHVLVWVYANTLKKNAGCRIPVLIIQLSCILVINIQNHVGLFKKYNLFRLIGTAKAIFDASSQIHVHMKKCSCAAILRTHVLKSFQFLTRWCQQLIQVLLTKLQNVHVDNSIGNSSFYFMLKFHVIGT